MIENLLLAAFNETPPIITAKDIRILHLEALEQKNKTFYESFYIRQRNNHSTTASLATQLEYVEKLKNIRFLKPELNRILMLKQILAKMSDDIRMPLLEAFKYKPEYDDNHVAHLNAIRAVLVKTARDLNANQNNNNELQLAYVELIQLLFVLEWQPGTISAIEVVKFQVTYNEILAITQTNLLSQKPADLQSEIQELMLADEQFAAKLQAELWDDLLQHRNELKHEVFRLR